MKKTIRTIILILLATSIFLSACVYEPELAPEAQTAVAQTLEMIVKQSQAPTHTVTPNPPTATATATSTVTPTSTPTLIPTATQFASGPVDFPENVNPLTGLEVENPELLNRRPVFVKVSNYPVEGRPHAGLSFADMVFEYYTGYGGNRFMALYYGQDCEKIGPVRSGRLVDRQIVYLYRGILGFVSAWHTVLDEIYTTLGNRAISEGGNTCPGVCDDGRNTEYSVFGDSAALTEIVRKKGLQLEDPNLDGMCFDPQSPTDGSDGNTVTVKFSDLNVGEWRYDSESGKYLRWIEEKTSPDTIRLIPLVDALTDEQLAFSNVIIMYANYEEYGLALHDIHIWDNYSKMRAVIFRDGQAHDVFWRTADGPIRFIYADGTDFPLKPGNSWVVIMGHSTPSSVSDGAWTFRNYIY